MALKATSEEAVKPVLILASSSSRRLELLGCVGIVPAAVMPAAVDEAAYVGEKPRECALRLAKMKAGKIAKDNPGTIVLGADTVVAKGRRIFPIAQSELQARRCLEMLSGGWHRVFTGIVAVQDQISAQRVVQTRVQFKRLSEEDLELHIANGEWKNKPGGYSIQGHASEFVIQIRGSYTNVVGLPIFETCALLRGLGLPRAEHKKLTP